MKLINNYDLMDKIQGANGVISYQKILLKELKKQVLFYGAFAIFDLAVASNHEVQWLTNTTICSTFLLANVVVRTVLETKFKDTIQYKSFLELTKLSLQLADLNINTNPFLLKEAEVIQTDYKVRFNEKYRPILEQNKYILVPSYDSIGEVKDTSIIQEHNVGSKEWILSIGSPEKRLKLSPVFG